MRATFLFSLLTVFLFSCDPQQDDKIDLPPPPTSAEFSIEQQSANPNNFTLRNTTAGAFQYLWDLGNGKTATGETTEAFYPEMGSYEVTLTVFTAGGSASSSKVIEVPEDAPFQCEGNPLYEFLSDCTQKVWKLNPAAGALWVGPTDASTTWWASGLNDVADRYCAWDDTWTFTGEGKMIYSTNGDIWGEDYMGFNFECVDESQLQASQAAWGSGEHAYALVDGTPNQLILTGLGAFMGLPKVANGSEVNTPQQGVTYDILRMEENGDNDILEIEVNYSAGIWRFTFVSE
ncbi:MAG: PKD domain-containing protein [Saprospiraceae bacterium]